MGCMLQQHGNSPYEFTSNPGTVNLKIVQPSAGSVQFLSTCAIKDQNNQTVNYTLSNNNETLSFNAVQGNSYSLALPYACMPSSCYGLLEEDCNGSELSLSLISVNASAEIFIAC
jgi:hypothetical protein